MGWRSRCEHIRTPKSLWPRYGAFNWCLGLPGATNCSHLKHHQPESLRFALPGVNMFAHLSVMGLLWNDIIPEFNILK